eukprot:805269-Prorocentrum_minimum.AAC.1
MNGRPHARECHAGSARWGVPSVSCARRRRLRRLLLLMDAGRGLGGGKEGGRAGGPPSVSCSFGG